MTSYTINDDIGADAGRPLDASITDGKNGQYAVRVNGADRKLRVISVGYDTMEFVLDGVYHKARYASKATRNIEVVVDGVPLSLGAHAELDEIVYKNSGGAAAAAGGGGASAILSSQIPGKVVSISVSEGDAVQKGDVVCTLESMKMQVGVKAHKAGTISAIKVAESDTVAKGDPIAEIE